MLSSLYIINESPRGKPSIISPGVSESSYSPASNVASVSSHVEGGLPNDASVLHLTSRGSSLVLSQFRPTRNVLKDRITLHLFPEGQLRNSINGVPSDGIPLLRGHIWGVSNPLVATTKPFRLVAVHLLSVVFAP